MKNFLIAGNWKMNTTFSEATELSTKLLNFLVGEEKNNEKILPEILLCPPFVSIQKIKELTAKSQIKVGSQNCHFEKKGAFTGEISVEMLKSVGCEYIIVGHSERRTIFGETNEFINQKIKSVLAANLTPILCIGETIDERKAGKTFAVLENQLNLCLQDIDKSMIYDEKSKAAKIVIAYEPIWAIGTGISATSEEVAEAHSWLRNFLVTKFGNEAENIFLLYGGSLTDANAKEILSIENVNGGLIGGASLVAEKFISIIKTANILTK